MKMTRRALAGLAALSAVPVSKSAAQTAASRPAETSPASQQFQNAARRLASVKLARTVEPATRFEA